MPGFRSKYARLSFVLASIVTCTFVVFVHKRFESMNKINEWIKNQQVPSLPSMQLPASRWSPWAVPSNNTSGDDIGPGGTLRIPSDQVLEKMNDQQMGDLYWKYINTVQTLCRNQTRLGSFKDGGKEICIDNEFLPRKPCIVYSFGSNFQFDFEQAVISAFGCEVYTFDPTLNLKQRGKSIPGNVHFYLKGLHGHDHVTPQKWEMRTLDTIMKELGHENKIVDILKIDIEGGEWHALPQMIKTGAIQRAKQLQIEIHYGQSAPKRPNWGDVNSRDQLKALRELYNAGFKIFMREHNLFSLKAFKSPYNNMYTNVNEISLVNERYKKS